MIDWPIFCHPCFALLLLYLSWKDLRLLYVDIRDLYIALIYALMNIGYLLFIQSFSHVYWNLLAALFAWLIFFLIWLFSKKKGIGEGEWRLAPLLLMNIGFVNTLEALYFSFIIAALVSILGLALGKLKKQQAIPFIPFIALGIFIALFFPLA